MKALVTGGSGFLGRYLVKELVKRNIETVNYDKNFPSIHRMEKLPAIVTCINGDIRDLDKLTEVMDGCDIVFHTAAMANLDETRGKPIQTMEVNVIGTVNCLEAAKITGVKRFLFASSVYASGKWGSFYRVSKQAGENLCKTFYQEYGLHYTILRYGSLYGGEANHWNFMYNMCMALLKTGEFHYPGSRDAVREYIHIIDAARETVNISMDDAYAQRIAMITGHQRLKVGELFEMIEEILGKDINITYSQSAERRHYVRTPYSFEPDVPLRVNLSHYVDISEGLLDCIKEVNRNLKKTDCNNEHNK
jgi:UDP-glucose 4-epimerase